MSNKKYIGMFESYEDIIDQFNAPKGALDNCKVLLAWYGSGSYDGCAFVLYKNNGKLFEVNGSHCSCNGLEGQWYPEKTTWEALKNRKIDSYYDDGKEANDLLHKLVLSHLN